MRSFADPETHFSIVPSGSPPSVDGLAISEPKYLACAECDARVRIDEPDGHQTAIDEIPHSHGCSQRDVKSRWWEDHYVDC